MYYSTIHHFVQICMVYFLRLRTGVNYLLIYRGLFLIKAREYSQMGWSLDRFFYRSMTPSSVPRADSGQGQGGFARPRKACWRVFAAWRKQALRGGRVRPPSLCLGVAHPRYRGSRAFSRRRGLAAHALMPTSGERPSGARAISRPFLRKFLNFFQPNNSMRAWVGHLFKQGRLNSTRSEPPVTAVL